MVYWNPKFWLFLFASLQGPQGIHIWPKHFTNLFTFIFADLKIPWEKTLENVGWKHELVPNMALNLRKHHQWRTTHMHAKNRNKCRTNLAFLRWLGHLSKGQLCVHRLSPCCACMPPLCPTHILDDRADVVHMLLYERSIVHTPTLWTRRV